MAESEEATFADLGLRADLLTALTRLGYEEPTPIQAETIPPLLAGHDLVLLLQGLHDIRLCAEDSWGNRACTPARRYDFSSQVISLGT